MNYYPFHIGDYASATRHLSWDEDLAYRRLLDWYYTNEKSLPLDVAKTCRLVVATTDSQRAAVDTVLREFFVETEDGWRHSRADEELATMREKQEASEERDEHEKTRQQKHRERRSAMFALLADRGVYPAWNAKTAELERLIADNGDAPDTPAPPSVVTAPVTALVTPATAKASQPRQPATAIPTPTPTPTPTLPGVEGGKPPKPPAFEMPSWIPADAWQEFVEMRRAKGKRSPFTVAAAKGIVRELERLRVIGNEPGEVLRQSVRNGWSDVFPLKSEGQSQSQRGRTPGTDWTGSAT